MSAIISCLVSLHLDLVFAVISAILWVVSSVVESKTRPHRVVLTFDGTPAEVDLHNLTLTMRLQSKWNRIAAISTAIAVSFQVFEKLVN